MAASILMAAVFAGVTVYLAGRRFRELRFRENGLGKSQFWAAAACVFLGGLLLRLYLGYGSVGFESDMATFKAWARITNEVGFHRIYREDIFLDYPPGYLYVLTFLEKIRLWLGLDANSSLFSLMIRLPSICADLACAGVVLALAKRKLGEKNALFLAGVYLFCPAVFINSAQWGQADSFCTAILLVSVLLLYRESYVPSALLYGVAIACKPQMLVFAPLYLFCVLKRKNWKALGLGLLAAVAAILLIATPFTQHADYLWLIDKYKSTMDFYSYYSVNAYNLWALLGMNWQSLPEGGLWNAVVHVGGPLLATALCGVVVLKSKRRDAMWVCPALLMTTVYLFSVKMHERYLFPALLFLLLAYVFARDRRLLYAFAGIGALHYINVAYVLHLFVDLDGSYDPNTMVTKLLALLQFLAYGYFLYVVYSVYLRGTVREPREQAEPLPVRFPSFSFLRADWIAVAIITLLYGLVAFWNLGSHETAVTAWTPGMGESVVVQADAGCGVLTYLPGIAPDETHYTSRVGVNVKVETSTDGETWADCGTLTDSSVFAWKNYTLETPGSYLRLTAQDERVTLNEIGLKRGGDGTFAVLTPVSGEGGTLLDEQGVLPEFLTYENSTYFDEIYHARTAYEYLQGLEPYENTHPTLGKQIIALGILIFGMNPFGWRFMGALFGVLMLPVLYHLLKQLFGKTSLSCVGTLLFAFDFMHFTQTRIATIDTYAVFFLLLMYDSMVVFLRRDLKTERMRRLLLPLLACGVFTGLGIAAKWTAAYGAVGLGVLFFGKLLLAWFREKRESGEPGAVWRRSLRLCLWCCLFFLLIPFGIYFAAFLPLTTLPHNIGRLWSAFVSYQTTMFNYHSQLVATHYFASPWYEWPLDVRPIWYFSGDAVNAGGSYSTISAMGNPILWWSFLPAFFGAAALWLRKRKPGAAVAVVGALSAYLPWTLVPRLTFIYHYFTAVPFLIVALCCVLDRLGETRFFRTPLLQAEGERPRALTVGAAVMLLFLAVNLILFAVFFPVISGAPTTRAYADSLEWFPTWYFA